MPSSYLNLMWERGATNGFTLRVWDDAAKTIAHNFGTNKVRIIVNQHGSNAELWRADNTGGSVTITGNEVGVNAPPSIAFPESGAATYLVEEVDSLVSPTTVVRLLRGRISFGE